MTEPTPKTLSCPSCGAPLDYERGSTFIQCKFCKTTSIMPVVREQQTSLTPVILEEIRLLVQDGNMVEAVRRFRAITGMDLKSAKNSVELLTSGQVMMASQINAGPLTPEQTGHILEQVQELLQSDNKLEAIHRYREATDVSLTKAREVVERVEAALKGLPVPQPIQIPGQVSTVQSTSRVRRRSWFGAFLSLGILLFISGLLALIFFLPGGPFNAMLISNGPAVLSTTTISPGLAGVFYNVTDETRLIAMLDPVTGKLRWRSESMPGDGYADAMLITDNLVVVANGSNLLAYRAEDGSLAWHTVMPDRLNYSESSMVAVAGRILVNTADQSIQAYDAVTGRLVWDRRLEGYDRTLRLVGESLVVMDYTGDDYTYSLVFLDPLDGEEQRILTPACPMDEFSGVTIDTDAGFVHEPSTDSLYLVYDSSPGCIQRFNLVSNQTAWQVLDEEWYSFSSAGFTGFLTADKLIYGSGNRLLAVNMDTGFLQVLLEEEDYDLLPMAESDGTLIVRLKRTRGTEHYELRGIDITTGSMLWRQDIGDAKPIDPPDEMVGLIDKGYPGYTWHLVESELILVRFYAAPIQITIQSINPSDGSISDKIVVPLKTVSGDFYSVPQIISWQEDLLYLELDGKMYCINVVAGEVVFHFK